MMGKQLSVNNLDVQLGKLKGELNHAISIGWDDNVGRSYEKYIADEETKLSHIAEKVKKSNEKYEYVDNVKIVRFKQTYNDYNTRFVKLSRGN